MMHDATVAGRLKIGLLPLVRGWTRKRVNAQYSFKHLKNHDIYVSGIWRQGRWLLLVFVQLSTFLTERLIFFILRPAAKKKRRRLSYHLNNERWIQQAFYSFGKQKVAFKFLGVAVLNFL